MARWDWYQATVRGSENEVIPHFLKHFDLAEARPCRAQNGYHHAAEIYRGDAVLATLFWGGNPGLNVKATGDRSPDVAGLLRATWEHFPSRVDACEDWVEPGLFNALSAGLLAYALGNRIRVHQEGDWARGEGRTLYLGSRSSPVQLVLYEKGYQLDADPAWVRLEVRVRPKGEAAKLQVSRWAPGEAFGAARWVTEALACLGWDHLQARSVGTVWKPTDTDRQRAALLRQYGPIILKWADEVGGFQELAKALERELQNEASLTV